MTATLVEVAFRLLSRLSLQVALAVLIAAAAAVLLRRADPRLRHAVWVLLLMRLAIPLPISTSLGLLPAGQVPPSADAAVFADGTLVAPQPPARSAAPASAVTASGRPASPLASLLVSVWAATLVALGAFATLRIGRAARRLREARPAGMEIAAAASRLARRIGLRRTPPVLVIRDRSPLPAPALFGLLRPAILLPESCVSRWPADERDAVLLHELVHVRRRDPLLHALSGAVRAFYFFHPAVWYLEHALHTERELVCDREVATRLGDPRAYARTLLHLAERRSGTRRMPFAAVGMAERRSTLERRIRRMAKETAGNDQDPPLRRAWRLAAASAVAALSIALAADHARFPALSSAGIPGVDVEILNAVAYEPLEDGAWPTPYPDEEVRFGEEIERGTAPQGADLLATGGDLLYRVWIDTEGRVSKVQWLRGASKRIATAYRDYVRSFQFEPTRSLAGTPLAVRALVRFAPANPDDGPLYNPGVQGVSEPEIEQRIEPDYPTAARNARVEGSVILRATIGSDGLVRDIRVLKRPPERMGFVESAIAAVSGWRYRPATLDGRPVPILFTISVRFTMDGLKEPVANEE